MFTGFFYALKKHRVPISITEWMTLMEALARGYITNLDEFYFLARAILIKSEAYFDHYDVSFQEYFKGVESIAEITDQVLKWLNDPFTRKLIDQELPFGFTGASLDELMKELEKRLTDLKSEYEAGQKMLVDLEAKKADLQTTLLRISGAVQVFEELPA